MSEDLGKEIAKELAKSVYDDAGKSVAKPTGELLGLVPRAIKAALSPVENWILKREYSVAETRKLLEQKLESIPAELIEEPEPYIALPAMESISYCMDNEELREMYANLLAKSMIKDYKNGVHPGFVEIIKQLCPDEAKILTYFKAHPRIPIVSLWFAKDGGGAIQQVKKFSNVGELTECEYPNNISSYFDNLSRLGLLNIDENSPLNNKSLYEPLKKHPLIIDNSNNPLLSAFGFNTSRILEGYVELTDFGKTFCNICIEDKPLIIKQTDKTEE